MSESIVRKWLTCKSAKPRYTQKRSQSAEMQSDDMDAISLSKYFQGMPTTYVKDCGHIPILLTNAAFVIERNVKTKGIFQNMGTISKTIAAQLSGYKKSKLKTANVNDVIELMKKFLASLSDPLLPEQTCDSMIQYLLLLNQFRNSFPHTFAILHFVMRILSDVLEHARYNGMDAQKLATIFVLDVIRPMKTEDSSNRFLLTERMRRLPYLILVVENLIQNVDIFKILGSMDQTSFQQRVTYNAVPVVTSQPTATPAAVNGLFPEKRYSLNSPQRQSSLGSSVSTKAMSESAVGSQDSRSQKEISPDAPVYIIQGHVKVSTAARDKEGGATDVHLTCEENSVKLQEIGDQPKEDRRPKRMVESSERQQRSVSSKHRKGGYNKCKAEVCAFDECKREKSPEWKNSTSPKRRSAKKGKQKCTKRKRRVEIYQESLTSQANHEEKEIVLKDEGSLGGSDVTEKIIKWLVDSIGSKGEAPAVGSSNNINDGWLRGTMVVEEMRGDKSESVLRDLTVTLTSGAPCRDEQAPESKEVPESAQQMPKDSSIEPISSANTSQTRPVHNPCLKIYFTPGKADNLQLPIEVQKEVKAFIEKRNKQQKENDNPQQSPANCETSSARCDNVVGDSQDIGEICDNPVAASLEPVKVEDVQVRSGGPVKVEDVQITSGGPAEEVMASRRSDELTSVSQTRQETRQVVHFMIKCDQSSLRAIIRQPAQGSHSKETLPERSVSSCVNMEQ